MSVNPRPPLLRVLSEQRAVWLVIPAIALLAGLVFLGKGAVTGPTTKPGEPDVAAAAAATAVAGAATPAPAPAPVPKDFTGDQRKEIEKIVKNYLITNPEIFLEAQTALEAKMEKEQAEKLKVAIAENAKEIYRDPQADVAGNANGDITVVEFFDYNCGYCKRGLHDVIKLVETDSNVRVVFKELPILSKGSEEASRVAIAAGKQGKYWDVHKAMLEAKGVMNEANALAIATKLGLDIDKLKKDMASPEVEAEIKKSEALAKKMGVNGTPHFLVGDRAIPGAPEDLYDQLEKHVTELRKSGCSYC
jgi:protein-disulfide isomerase